MNSNQLLYIFESLDHNKNGRVSIKSFIECIKNSDLVMADTEDIEKIITCFDPNHSGQVTFESFQSGVQTLCQLNNLAANYNSYSPVESSSPHSNSEVPHKPTNISNIGTNLPQQLIDFNTEVEQFPLESNIKCDANIKHRNLLPTSGTECTNDMSILNTSANSFNFTQAEEHFEFTPTKDSDDNIKNVDIVEDFSFSNGDSSYSSLKSNFPQRNTWLTTSLKRPNHMKRNFNNGPYVSTPNSSFRNSPTNGTSRRSSISYESDEMNNEQNSLEDYIQNLTEKIKKLQDQIQILSEGQTNNEEKYTSIKKENSNLHNKINFLEEQIRDIEYQSENKRKEDERNFKESMARIEREKVQELENCVNRICSLQKELVESKEEIKRHQQTIERLQYAKSELEEDLQDKNSEIISLKEENEKLKELIRLKEEESHANCSLIDALNQELSVNKKQNEDSKVYYRPIDDCETMNSINMEFEEQLRILKEENRSLKENNEELTAQLLNNHVNEGKSLIRESEAVSSLANEINDLNIEQVKKALKEQQDVNEKLRTYMDRILLNIIENSPQLLELKPN